MRPYTNDTLINIVTKEIFHCLNINKTHTKIDFTLDTSNLFQENNKFDPDYFKNKLESLGFENIIINNVYEYQVRLIADVGTFRNRFTKDENLKNTTVFK